MTTVKTVKPRATSELKWNLYFTYEFRSCPDLFSALMALRIQTC